MLDAPRSSVTHAQMPFQFEGCDTAFHDDITLGGCTFSQSGAHTFRDAIWIKAYNGLSKAPDGSCESADFVYWSDGSRDPLVLGSWKECLLGSRGRNYVEDVCNDL